MAPAPNPKPARDPQHASPAFYASCALGLVGLVLIVTGAVFGNRAVAIVGYGFGAGSLFAALTWRAELIRAWRAAKQQPPTRPAGGAATNGHGQAPTSPRSS